MPSTTTPQPLGFTTTFFSHPFIHSLCSHVPKSAPAPPGREDSPLENHMSWPKSHQEGSAPNGSWLETSPKIRGLGKALFNQRRGGRTQRKPSSMNPGLKSSHIFSPHLGYKQSPERRRIYGAGGGEVRVPRVPRHTALLSDCTLASIAGAPLTELRFGTPLLNVSLAAGRQLSQFPPTAREQRSPRISSTL